MNWYIQKRVRVKAKNGKLGFWQWVQWDERTFKSQAEAEHVWHHTYCSQGRVINASRTVSVHVPGAGGEEE